MSSHAVERRPTDTQQALLRAALFEGAAAAASWRDWMSCSSLDALDEDSTWLLPLLYYNLSSQQLAPQERLVRYENVFRHNWYKNHLALHHVKPRIEDIAAAGDIPIVRGGAALALGYYPALAARPFEAVQVDAGASEDEQTTAHEWKGMRVHVPAPERLLRDVCGQREEWDRRSSLLWIADAALIVRGYPSAIGSAGDVLDELRAMGLVG
jgi:hypothetical protein